ncbi:MAG: hypothetical protein EXS14_07410, partial [Planctomycetes bacterium]|nr:hypothetical protein [Planctomycetota bacterium]
MRVILLLLLVAITPQLCAQAAARTEPQGDGNWTSLFAPPPMRAPDQVRSMTGSPGANYWQQQADCTIRATLDEVTARVSAHLTVDYTNNSPEALSYLWFHLEQNIFRPDSIARGVAAVGGAAAERIEAQTDGAVVEAVSCRGRDLQFTVHDTLMRVELARPVAADGGTVSIDIAW